MYGLKNLYYLAQISWTLNQCRRIFPPQVLHACSYIFLCDFICYINVALCEVPWYISLNYLFESAVRSSQYSPIFCYDFFIEELVFFSLHQSP